MSQEKNEYLSYLLRLWRGNDKDKPVWRASLREVQSGEQVGFTSLEALFTHIREQAGVEPGNSQKPMKEKKHVRKFNYSENQP